MQKSLSQFKKEVKEKKICLELIEVYGEKPTERVSGIREISKVQSNGFYLKSEYEGEIINSWLQYPKAKYFKYIEDYIEIYEEDNKAGEAILILKYKVYYL